MEAGPCQEIERPGGGVEWTMPVRWKEPGREALLIGMFGGAACRCPGILGRWCGCRWDHCGLRVDDRHRREVEPRFVELSGLWARRRCRWDYARFERTHD